MAGGFSLSGVTIDCFAGVRYNLANIPVYAFDARRSERLNDLIQAADNVPAATDDIEVVMRAWAIWDRLVRLARTFPRLARTKSGKDGSFTMNVPVSASDLIVFAYAPSDEGPAFIVAHARVKGREHFADPVTLAFPGCA